MRLPIRSNAERELAADPRFSAALGHVERVAAMTAIAETKRAESRDMRPRARDDDRRLLVAS